MALPGVILAVVILLLMSLPIFISLLLPAIAGLTWFDMSMPPVAVVQHAINGVSIPALLAVPLFMFAADIIAGGEIADRLVALMEAAIGHIPGGMAIATIMTMMLFGAISGVGVAAIVSIGPIAYPVLLKRGYSRGFALGLILSGATLSMLIPPSVAIILYGLQANQSIAQTFLTGLAAGIVFAIILIAFTLVYVRVRGLGNDQKFSLEGLVAAARRASLAILFPLIILGGIYGGITTVTEAAAVSVGYAVLVEIYVYKRLNWAALVSIARSSSKVIAMVMILIVGGSLLTWYLTLQQVPQLVANIGVFDSAVTVLLVINLIFLFAGMLVDVNSAIIILTPLVMPAALQVGIDPIHLGAVVAMNLAIGMISPPFGMNLFVGMATFKLSYKETLKAVMPFLLLMLVSLAIVTYIPQSTLWLRDLLF
ncbi:TRAP transporter large permease [Castellaniella sp. S9]|uniref:TRAP transporter large permease n=1 Tax=Castellaniella sp. S9 TaxID=2993652 RepID=UPI0022B5DE35|nr:TRAP transporter large permease [Castellaniella sp. S9]